MTAVAPEASIARSTATKARAWAATVAFLQRHLADAPRIRVDVEFYRSMREDRMIARAKELAERVRSTGQDADLPPMNSYYRRLIHQVFVDDPQVASVSAGGDARFKRVTLKRR